jgi:DNA polymerase III subunit delta'
MIIGHKKQQEILSKMILTRKIPHAMIFEGPSKLGKKKIALDFAEKLFCAKDDYNNLESCNSFKKGNHPDLTLISSLGKEIKIPEIRKIINKFSLKPNIAEFKIAIIDDAHLMNKDAQNSILKLLEEPEGKSIIIFITEYPDMILSTVRSRSVKIKFFSVQEEEIRLFLEKNNSKEIEKITLFSFNKPGIAIDLMNDIDKINERKNKMKEFIDIISESTPIYKKFNYIKKITENTEELEDLMVMWLNYFRSLMRKKAEGFKVNQSFLKIKKSLELIEKHINIVFKTNTNKNMVLEVLIMNL